MLKDSAREYINTGLCVLPARRIEKRPVPNWKLYQSTLPTSAEVGAWFSNRHDALCILAGAISGNVEMIDFDFRAELFEPWAEKIPPTLLNRLVIETTQSGGRHIIYRCAGVVCGSLKLAQRKTAEGKVVTLIETRGEGGIFLCAPTEGYELLQGDLADLPVIAEPERDILLQGAWELNEYFPAPVNGLPHGAPGCDVSRPSGQAIGQRPGDDFNARGDVGAILAAHGWAKVKGGENEYWRRPGKSSGWSASLKDSVLYVFSSNASPFEPNRAYSPFAVFALLNHGGDYEAAATSLRLQGFGSSAPMDTDVDISGLLEADVPDDDRSLAPPRPDPGPLPEELLRVPGFVGELMDYCIQTAPYPNTAMAFCGALALQAFLAGRKVRDPGDNRTNIYLLGLAHSSAGKDHPRKLNTKILHSVGLADCLGDRFASGEGVQDALNTNPSMLFQTDEIDGMLQSINRATDARYESIMNTLLTLYSASNSVFPMRRKAGKEKPGAIDQPSLVIFGTAIPNHYYQALSERMLTNGFFGRMIILEGGRRGKGQEPRVLDLPPRVVSAARWWADFQPGRGNLEKWHPVPKVVEHSDAARQAIIDSRLEAEAEYDKAEADADPVGTTVWGRVSEHVRKLSLIYAVSENHEQPEIGLEAVEWASRFVMHQTRRMLFMAAGHVAENPFHAECLKLLRKLRESQGQLITRNKLMRAMRCKVADFDQIVSTLVMQGDIVPVDITTKTKPAQGYRLP